MREKVAVGSWDSEALARYARAARRYPPLSREEEHDVALSARRGDILAEQKLVRHNLSLVLLVAGRQRRGTLRLDDLIQEGNLGLLRAAAKFDPHAGTRFSTYAVWWIRAFVGRHLRGARSTVRPRSGTVAQADVSLDILAGDEETLRLDLMTEESDGAEARFLAAERERAVRLTLPWMRRRVGELGWSILNDRLLQEYPKSISEVGLAQGVSRQHVRKVEARTKRYLRQALAQVGPAGDRARPAPGRGDAGDGESLEISLRAATG
jgi:RNA polymerase primary sigma factor